MSGPASPATSVKLREYILWAVLTIPFAGASAALAVYVIPAVFEVMGELRAVKAAYSEEMRLAREATETRAAREVQTAGKLEESRRVVLQQQADLIANQKAAEQLTTENLRLAAELNRELQQRRRSD